MRGHKGFFVVWVFFFALFLSATEGYSYTITASESGVGGTISPSGPVSVTAGADQTFTITPDPGYGLFDILVDSVSVSTALSYSYTFSNVQMDHSIEASFSACDYQFPVLLESNDWIYGTMMEAYNDAVPSDTIKLMAGPLPAEDLSFAADISVFLDGGYDCSFLEQNLITAIPGSLTVEAGTVIPSNIVLSGPLPCQMGDPINFPGNTETCDGLDNNCNGLIDDGLTFDSDGDGATALGSCAGSADDCDDNDANVFFGAPEICDDLDNNCDGQIDEGLPPPVDADGDGYFADGSCSSTADDCNDNDASIHPDAVDIPYDGIDQDCIGGDLTFTGESCADCHDPETNWNNIHDLTTPPDGTCVTCHAAPVYNVLSGHYGKTVRTAGNNMTAGSTIVCESCHDADSNTHSGGVTLGNGSNFVTNKITAVYPNITCDTCHEERHGAHQVEVGPNDLSSGVSCGTCHVVASWPEIEGVEHNVDTNGAGSCATCHNSPRAEVQITISAGTPPIHCLDCHFDKAAAHGIDHVAAGYVTLATSCAGCHDPDGAANATVDVTHNGNCSLCHTTVPHLQPGIPDGGGDCVTCHGDHFPNHTHHNTAANEVSYNPAVDTSQTSQQGCAVCHHDYDTVNGTSLGLSTWETILVEHDLDGPKDGSTDTCYSCHAYDGSSSPPLAAVQAAISSGNPATCATCHTDKVPDVDHGVPTSGKHTEHLALPGVSCSTCHGNIPYFKSGTDSNGDGLYDLSETDVCDSCHHDGAGNPATGFKDGWSDPDFELDCSSCHGYPPDYPSGSPKINSHSKHNEYGYSCAECHFETTNDGLTITDPALHANGVMDVTFNDPGIAYDPSSYTCSNTYCHSNGITVEGRTSESTSLPPALNLPRTIMPNTSAAWGSGSLSCTSCHSSENDPQTDGPDYPDANQGYQYKSNGHQDHEFLSCEYCHYATTTNGTSIANNANHVNGTYDVVGHPTEVPQLNYVYDAGGGTCSIQCHTSPYNHHSPTATYYWGFNTLSTRSAPYNVGCYEVRIDPDAYSTFGDGIAGPYTYYLEYYDSAAQSDDWDQPHLLLGTDEGTEPFNFTYPGPPAPGAYGYPLIIWSRDANNHRSANRHIQWAHPVATQNQDPVPDFEIQVNGNTVTLTDKSTDPDYNYCGNGDNGYQGTIRIDWKDYTSGYEDTIVELTDQPTNVEVTHTYSKIGSLRLLFYVQDNDGSWWISKWSDYFTVPGN